MATGHGGRDRMMKHLGTKYHQGSSRAVLIILFDMSAEMKETNDQRGCCEANPSQVDLS